MVGINHNSPGLVTVLSRVGRLMLRGFQTRVELLAVEWQQERLHLADLLARAIALVLLAAMGFMLLTATIIFLFPQGARIYVTGALAVLYLLGAGAAWISLRAGLNREPFSESMDQLKKDGVWLESLK